MIVEVDGLLDEAQPETFQTEIQIILRIIDRRGDVMQTEKRH
jgi:hypothetical protein